MAIEWTCECGNVETTNEKRCEVCKRKSPAYGLLETDIDTGEYSTEGEYRFQKGTKVATVTDSDVQRTSSVTHAARRKPPARRRAVATKSVKKLVKKAGKKIGATKK